MRVYYNKKSIDIPVRKVGFFGKYIGLMFKSKETRNLLFDFNKDLRRGIHSYFVFFPFLAIWLDNKNRVLESKIVYPFTSLVLPKCDFRKLVEIPRNHGNSNLIVFFVGKRKI